MAYLAEELKRKWGPVIEHPELENIKSPYKRWITATLLENTERELGVAGMTQRLLGEAGPTNSMGLSSSDASTGAIDTFDPVMISLVRRAMPKMIAYDLCGVQPMTGPTGLIFAMRSRYDNQTGAEAFYNEANTAQSGRGGSNTAATDAGYSAANTPGGAANNIGNSSSWSLGVANNSGNSTFNFAGGFNRSTLEGLGSNATAIFPEMAFSIEKQSVEAKGRGLKAEYSIELAQDLKAIHGLSAEGELANILSAEILAEINREIIRTIYTTAVSGAQYDTTTAGRFDLDVDSNGRWSVEKFKGLMFQIDRDANVIAKQTRRGKGNVIVMSSDVASALVAAGKLDYTPALTNNNLEIDDTGNAYAGILNGQYKVFVDPYTPAGFNFYVVGFKGPNVYDAGLFYCPYVPLQMVRGQNPDTMQPKIGYKTRYGIVANPFAEGATAGGGRIKDDSNVYYRRVLVDHLQG